MCNAIWSGLSDVILKLSFVSCVHDLLGVGLKYFRYLLFPDLRTRPLTESPIVPASFTGPTLHFVVRGGIEIPPPYGPEQIVTWPPRPPKSPFVGCIPYSHRGQSRGSHNHNYPLQSSWSRSKYTPQHYQSGSLLDSRSHGIAFDPILLSFRSKH